VRIIALIVAAGQGLRAGGVVPKQYQTIAGLPMLHHTVRRFAEHPRIDAVRVVIAAEHRDLYDAALRDLPAGLAIGEPVLGAAERQGTVLNGLEALAADPPDLVLIQDAARPFVPDAVIDRVIDALAEHPGALPVLPVVDTVKRGAGGLVAETVPRADLWRAQTPQGFRYADILAAHRDAARSETVLTDDAAVAEAAGLPVALVEGDETAMKITSQTDIEAADIEAGSRDRRPRLETRVGIGYDVHRLGPGTEIVLGGVTIPNDGALIGHSDADVGLHAITDAVFGALGDGDIGSHFPPSDMTWKGAASDQFLAHAVGRVRAAGGEIRHLDLVLICERPKVGPHREAMRARIAEICGVAVSRVSVKATTSERLGFTGRREGIAAQAVATIALPEDPA